MKNFRVMAVPTLLHGRNKKIINKKLLQIYPGCREEISAWVRLAGYAVRCVKTDDNTSKSLSASSIHEKNNRIL